MSKNKFGIPGIVFEPTPVPGGNVIGGGSAQGGQGNNDLPVSFAVWSTSADYAEVVAFYDQEEDGADMGDYGMWWADCDYSFAQWEALGYTQAQWDQYVAPNLW